MIVRSEAGVVNNSAYFLSRIDSIVQFMEFIYQSSCHEPLAVFGFNHYGEAKGVAHAGENVLYLKAIPVGSPATRQELYLNVYIEVWTLRLLEIANKLGRTVSHRQKSSKVQDGRITNHCTLCIEQFEQRMV